MKSSSADFYPLKEMATSRMKPEMGRQETAPHLSIRQDDRALQHCHSLTSKPQRHLPCNHPRHQKSYGFGEQELKFIGQASQVSPLEMCLAGRIFVSRFLGFYAPPRFRCQRGWSGVNGSEVEAWNRDVSSFTEMLSFAPLRLRFAIKGGAFVAVRLDMVTEFVIFKIAEVCRHTSNIRENYPRQHAEASVTSALTGLRFPIHSILSMSEGSLASFISDLCSLVSLFLRTTMGFTLEAATLEIGADCGNSKVACVLGNDPQPWDALLHQHTCIRLLRSQIGLRKREKTPYASRKRAPVLAQARSKRQCKEKSPGRARDALRSVGLDRPLVHDANGALLALGNASTRSPHNTLEDLKHFTFSPQLPQTLPVLAGQSPHALQSPCNTSSASTLFSTSRGPLKPIPTAAAIHIHLLGAWPLYPNDPPMAATSTFTTDELTT
ncbi:uncharacterized protein BDR25DRAFT_355797 [Lindgomyces ingoldianus]|uniref:Uncharacterized protein n=1 Tax=Lindgomyces ingoldianus TaxID=673940 RepID=A0ACB6QSU9_9PLEO|nr:uncharacterized protein BDR25DRAFT_355797 [Lindgomyces ingoldianus]KAF2470088.1 hypothetical protein BDR25DRAFT_355797 [Lindgomyces ingoldianus]